MAKKKEELNLPTNAEVYKERENTNAKNSGINLTPPK